MPINPKPYEKRDEFMHRCISTEIELGFPRNQAVAICASAWDRNKLISKGLNEVQIQQRMKVRYENIYASVFARRINDMIAPVIDLFEQGRTPEEVINAIPVVMKVDQVNTLYKNMYKDVAPKFGARIHDRYKMKASEDWMNLFGQEFDSFVDNYLADNIRSITETNRNDAINAIKEIVKQNNELGMNELSNKIQKELPDVWETGAKWKSLRIASTEVNTAANRGIWKSSKDIGVPMIKSWRYGGINVRSWHQINQQRRIDEPFMVNGEEMQYPGDPTASAANIVNCKCGMVEDVV